MKKVVFLISGMLMLGLTGCMKSGENIQYYQYIAAIVEWSPEFGFELQTSVGRIISTKVQNATDLLSGEAVVAFFYVNFDQQPSTEYTMAYDMEYYPITLTSPHPTSGGESVTGDFVTPIEGMYIQDMFVCDRYKPVIFIAFAHTAPTNQEFIYEMTYDPNENTDAVYLRAKKKGQGTKAEANIAYLYAFDMTYYLMTLKDSGKDIKLNLYYKTGEFDGKDVYSPWNENPLPLE